MNILNFYAPFNSSLQQLKYFISCMQYMHILYVIDYMHSLHEAYSKQYNAICKYTCKFNLYLMK